MLPLADMPHCRRDMQGVAGRLRTEADVLCKTQIPLGAVAKGYLYDIVAGRSV